METAEKERPRTDLVEPESIQGENEGCMVAEAEAGVKGGFVNLERAINGGEKEWVETIRENTIEGIRSYFKTSGPSMKIAAVLLNEIMLTPSLNELGHEILSGLRKSIFNEEEMNGEDLEEINFMRGVICGVNFTTYLS